MKEKQSSRGKRVPRRTQTRTKSKKKNNTKKITQITRAQERDRHKSNEEREQQELTEVVPLVTSTTPVVVRGPVVSLEVGVLGLGKRIVRRAKGEDADEKRGSGRLLNAQGRERVGESQHM
jgi:hypothetical protein